MFCSSRPSGAGPKKAAGLVVAGAIALALSGCGAPSGAPRGGGGEGQVLRFGLSAEPAVPLTGMNQGGAVNQMLGMIHRGLMTYDADGGLVPGLAESVETPDATTYRFTLREGLVFHDDSPLTADNVKRTLDYYRDEANGTQLAGGLADIESISSDGARTVTITLSAPNTALLEYLALPFAAIVPDSALAAHAANWIGAGPFELTEFQEGVGATLTKDDDFYEASEVELERVEVGFYPDGEARTNALLGGDVDLIEYVPWENFDRVESAGGFTLDAEQGPFQFVQFNVTDDRPFADPRVRQAVAYAIDRENAVTAAFQSNGEPLAGVPIPEDDAAYDPSSRDMWGHDVERAKELLAEAGYPDGFSATMLATSQYAFLQDTALSVQQDLQAIGIDVTLDAPDWSTRVSKGNSGEYDIAVSGDVGEVTDPSYLLTYVSGVEYYNASWGYRNEELMGLIDHGLRATDDAQKNDAYRRVYDLWADEVPIASIDTRAQAYAHRDGVEGFATLPGFLVFYSSYTIAGVSVE